MHKYSCIYIHTMMGFPGGSDDKESACNARDLALIKGMATHSSVLAWRIPWTEEPGGLQSMGSQSLTWLRDWHFYFTYNDTHFHPSNPMYICTHIIIQTSIYTFIYTSYIHTIKHTHIHLSIHASIHPPIHSSILPSIQLFNKHVFFYSFGDTAVKLTF